MSDNSLKKYQDLVKSGKLEETIILTELFTLENRDRDLEIAVSTNDRELFQAGNSSGSRLAKTAGAASKNHSHKTRKEVKNE